jgi:hypothetical protein
MPVSKQHGPEPGPKEEDVEGVDTEAMDEDEMVTAEPLAPVKQSEIPTRPRYILMGLAVLLFIVLIIVVAVELIEKQDNINAQYVSHHAVIFGSKSIVVDGCVVGDADDDDVLTMGINLNAPRAFVFSSGAGVGFGPLQGGR